MRNEKPQTFRLFVEALTPTWKFLAQMVDAVRETIMRETDSQVGAQGDQSWDNNTSVKSVGYDEEDELDSLPETSGSSGPVIEQEQATASGPFTMPRTGRLGSASPMIKQRSLDSSFDYEPDNHLSMRGETLYADNEFRSMPAHNPYMGHMTCQCAYDQRELASLHNPYFTGPYQHPEGASQLHPGRTGLHKRRLGLSQPDLSQGLHLQIPDQTPGWPYFGHMRSPSLNCIGAPTYPMDMASPQPFSMPSPRPRERQAARQVYSKSPSDGFLHSGDLGQAGTRRDLTNSISDSIIRSREQRERIGSGSELINAGGVQFALSENDLQSASHQGSREHCLSRVTEYSQEDDDDNLELGSLSLHPRRRSRNASFGKLVYCVLHIH